jgi:hypothetical protein
MASTRVIVEFSLSKTILLNMVIYVDIKWLDS